MDKYRIILTVEERARLEHMTSSGKAAARRLTHARVLLLADELHGEACSDAEILSALGTSVRTIERLRRRFVPEGFEAALDHRPQPPRPDRNSPASECNSPMRSFIFLWTGEDP